MKKLDIKKGEKYGRLVIIKEVEQMRYISGKPYRNFLCKCECGNVKKVLLNSLRKGKTQSCGCLHSEVIKQMAGIQSITHGMFGTKIYGVYAGIKRRCNNKNVKNYNRYGARGIKCEWETFEEFYKDMGDTYKEGLSIERINNDGNYCKENCKWANRKEQARNRRNNRLYKGKCIAEWCEILGLNPQTVSTKINRGRKTIKEALQINR